MGGGGELVSMVAERELDLAEELFVGEIGELFGHVGSGLRQQGSETRADGLNAGLAFSGVVGAVIRGVRQHGCSPAVRSRVQSEFPVPNRSYWTGRHFPPNFLNRTPKADGGAFRVPSPAPVC